MHSALLVSRIRSEFLEMPGLQLTLAQAARLWGLEPRTCQDVVDALVESAFLRWTPRGTIVRADTSVRQMNAAISLRPEGAAIR